MITKKLLTITSLLSLVLQLSFAQKTSDWLKEGAILDIFHVINGPYSEREDINSFLNDEYMPVMESAYPGTFSFHVEGIAGDRKGQHAKFWIFPTVEERDSYFPKAGGQPTLKYIASAKELEGKISENKTIELFRGWDFDFKTDWHIVAASDQKEALTNLRGLEMDVHYLHKKQNKGPKALQEELTKLLNNLKNDESQFFILYGDRDTRKKTFAVLELHTPGKSQKEVLTALDFNWEENLYSSYRIW